MSAFFYGLALQWRLDIRSKSLLITCYVVPLLFFAIMGGIFTSINPEAKATLIQSMTVMGVTMGALIGCRPPWRRCTEAISRKCTEPMACRYILGWYQWLYLRFSIFQ